MKEDQLSENEKQRFEELTKEKMPPRQLLDKIIQQLKSENLIKIKSYTMKKYMKWAASVAAVVLIFYLGRISAEGISIDPNKGYMLILHEDEQFKPGDPNDMFKEYAQWMLSTIAKGVIITGQEFKEVATLVDNQKNIEYRDSKAADRVTGYFIVEAESLEEAIQIAKDNPHIKYGGSIEIKEYMVR